MKKHYTKPTPPFDQAIGTTRSIQYLMPSGGPPDAIPRPTVQQTWAGVCSSLVRLRMTQCLPRRR
jgi:hypothetical protein